MRTQVPFSEAPVTTRVEALADPPLEKQRGRGLAHLPLDLVGVVLLLRAVRGEGVELGAVGRRGGSPASAALSRRCVMRSG